VAEIDSPVASMLFKLLPLLALKFRVKFPDALLV
jgi:hypothetical protein